jgi:hypothetical protein
MVESTNGTENLQKLTNCCSVHIGNCWQLQLYSITISFPTSSHQVATHNTSSLAGRKAVAGEKVKKNVYDIGSTHKKEAPQNQQKSKVHISKFLCYLGQKFIEVGTLFRCFRTVCNSFDRGLPI